MKHNDGLYLLIDSLTSTEKRFFRLFAKRNNTGETNDCLFLFDAINNQVQEGEYNEEKLIHYLKEKKRKIHLRNAKNYLHGLILRSMRQVSDEENVTRQLQARIADINFLIDKGLISKAGELLRKARKTAHLYEKFIYELQLIGIERKIVRLSQDKLTGKRMKEFELHEKQLLKQIRMESGMRILYDRVYVLIRSGLVPEKQKASARKLAVHSQFKEKRSNTFSIETLRLLSLSDLALLSGDDKRSRALIRLIINLYDRNPHQFRDEPLRYINILNNYLNACFRLQRFDEFPGIIRRIEQLEGLSKTVRFEIFKNATFLKLLFLMNTKQFSEALRIVPEIELGLKVFDKKLPIARKLSFCYNVMILFFFSEKFQDALRWANKLLEREHQDVRRDLQHATSLFSLIILFERGHHDLLENKLRNTARHLRKTGEYNVFEQFILTLLGNLLTASTLHKRKIVFREGVEFIENQPADFKKKQLCDEILVWMKASISGQKPADLL
ncbi:MAG: hypothetical protein MUC87_08765 [Bacteroidia bacterium]|jgi:hypothetical protein|nr:hypothetical protein [Bacteroidia bacterium]